MAYLAGFQDQIQGRFQGRFHMRVAVIPGLLRALFFGEKCATCVQFVECAGVR